MKAIVAVDNAWGIGNKNKLLISIPEDMKHFVKYTKNKIVIMGKNTLDSFPGGNPLKGRVNIVISSKEKIDKDIVLVSSIKEALEESKKFKEEDVFVIGGESVYKQLLPYCEQCIVTKINKTFEADAFFPNLDEKSNWELTEESENYNYEGIDYKFLIYKNMDVKCF